MDVVAGSFFTVTDSVTLWHFGFKAHTKCISPSFQSVRALSLPPLCADCARDLTLEESIGHH